MDALGRVVVGGLYLILFVAFILPLLFTVGLVLGIIDVIWQFILNREGIEPMNLFRQAWMVQIQNATWALTGEGEFQLALW
jgi:hypothetical protein